MKIQYLFSGNKKIFSRLISWASKYDNTGLKKIPSHTAVLLNDAWVVESTLFTGVRMIPYSRWKMITTEYYKIDCEHGTRDSDEVMRQAARLWDKGYDWKGVLYFSYAFIRSRILKEPMPAVNKWQRANRYFCSEFIGSLKGENYSMMTPASICKSMLDCSEEEK